MKPRNRPQIDENLSSQKTESTIRPGCIPSGIRSQDSKEKKKEPQRPRFAALRSHAPGGQRASSKKKERRKKKKKEKTEKEKDARKEPNDF